MRVGTALPDETHSWLLSFSFNLVVVVAGLAGIIVWRLGKKTWGRGVEQTRNDILSRPHDLCVEVISGPSIRLKIRAIHTGEPVTIGRSPENVVAIANDYVSGEHARISWRRDKNRWALRDSGSLNGTLLNNINISSGNRRIGEDHLVGNGDIIILAEGIVLRAEVCSPCASANVHTCNNRKILKAAPESGRVNCPKPRLPISVHNLPPRPDPITVQYFCPGLHAEFAISAQIGLHHWNASSASEDCAFWEVPFSSFQQAGLFGICDGHAGPSTSLELQRRLPEAINNGLSNMNSLLDSADGIHDLLMHVFPDLDNKLESQDGSTATVLMAERLDDGACAIQMANVGDSMGMIVNSSGDYEALTVDHRVSSPIEQARLKANKAPITHNGTRLFTLNLARVMGDSYLKKMSGGLIADPSVSKVVRLRPDQAASVILASDGLWDGLSLKEVANTISAVESTSQSLSDTLENLIKSCIHRNIGDDITIALIRFLPLSHAI